MTKGVGRGRQFTTIEDRAAEYVDSPLMTQRLQYKREISARIEGNYEVYRTRKPTLPFAGWEAITDEDLLATLSPSSVAVDAVRNVLQQDIDLLRQRGVSWSQIGDALGMSRQAAWKRFS